MSYLNFNMTMHNKDIHTQTHTHISLCLSVSLKLFLSYCIHEHGI